MLEMIRPEKEDKLNCLELILLEVQYDIISLLQLYKYKSNFDKVK